MRLDRTATGLIVIDVQQKLMPVIHAADEVTQNIVRLIRGLHILGVPVINTEQYVQGLGPTIEPVRQALEEGGKAYTTVEKTRFSIVGAMRKLVRKQILLAGVETHVCVYQSAIDLLAEGHEVIVIEDAVSSRTPANRDIALRRLAQEGAKPASTEMVLFELCADSDTPEFKAISRLIK